MKGLGEAVLTTLLVLSLTLLVYLLVPISGTAQVTESWTVHYRNGWGFQSRVRINVTGFDQVPLKMMEIDPNATIYTACRTKQTKCEVLWTENNSFRK